MKIILQLCSSKESDDILNESEIDTKKEDEGTSMELGTDKNEENIAEHSQKQDGSSSIAFFRTSPPIDYARNWRNKSKAYFRAIALTATVKTQHIEIMNERDPMVRICIEQEHYLDEQAYERNQEKLQLLVSDLKTRRSKCRFRKDVRKMKKWELHREKLEIAKLLIRIMFFDTSEWSSARNEAWIVLRGLKDTTVSDEAEELLERMRRIPFHMPRFWIHKFEGGELLDAEEMSAITKSPKNYEYFRKYMHKKFGETIKQDLYHRCKIRGWHAYNTLAEIFLPSDASSEFGNIVAPIVEEFLGHVVSPHFINHCRFGIDIPDIIYQYMGYDSFQALDEELFYAQHTLKLCFPCGFISNGGMVFAALKASRTNGVLTLPQSSCIQNPCPFCGGELHVNPPEFDFVFECPLLKDDGQLCGEKLHLTSMAFQHFAMHMKYDESIADHILDEYEKAYERWRIDTNSDAPALLEYTKCVQCENMTSEKNVLRCKGCIQEGAAMYCSAECQKRHWKLHKRYCARIDKKMKKKSCDKCSKALNFERMLRCKGCDPDESAFYCSTLCARADWKSHKKKCARLDKLNAVS